jgi:hypothetical protein
VEFGNRFLNLIIYGCITNTQFLRQIRQHFPVELFKSSVRKNIAQILFDYVDQYKEAPGDHFYDLFYDYIEDVSDKKKSLNIKFIEVLQEIEHINEQYVLDKIFEAIRHIRLEEAILDAARLVKNKKYDEVQRTILEALKDPAVKSFGYLDYFRDRDDVIIRMSEDPFLMKTMIPSMDKVIGGIRKREVVIWLGTPKSGKTFGLINMAHAALMQGLTVVFISLELHRYRVAGRMDQTAGFLGGLKERVQDIMVCEGGRWKKKKKKIKTIYDPGEVEKARSGLQRLGGKLIIASAPPNTKNYMDFEMLLDDLEIREGIVPHVLIGDYLRNMRGTSSSQNRKEKISENCQGLVKIGSERNIVVHSAQQGNRRAMSSHTLTPDMIADDIDPIGYVDIVPAICQTEAEEEDNKARIYLPIVRESASGAMIEIVRDLARGQFWLDDKLSKTKWTKDKKK